MRAGVQQLASLVSGRRVWRGLLASVLALGISAGAAAAVLGGKVVSVTDGDTIKVLDAGKVEHVVRLSGIDAPEKKMPFGQRSKQHLSDLVYGKWVEVEGEKHDRYGRLAGKVLVSVRLAAQCPCVSVPNDLLYGVIPVPLRNERWVDIGFE